MAFGMLFGFSEHIWETLLLLFIFIPVTLFWVLTIVSVIRRQDLTVLWKIVWLAAVILFPLVGTLVYWVRRPAIIVTEPPSTGMAGNVADAVDSVGVMLEHVATTMRLAQNSLAQGSELLRDVSDLLEKTGDTIGFTVPLTRIRPLRSTYADVQRFTRRSRTLAASLTRTAAALGTNAADIQTAAAQVDAISHSVRRGGARLPLRAIPAAAGDEDETSPVSTIPSGPGQNS